MGQREVILAQAALADLTSIVAYIADDSGLARASAVSARISKALETVGQMPNAGRIHKDISGVPRSLVVSPWAFYYWVLDDGRVFVARILDGRRDVPRQFPES